MPPFKGQNGPETSNGSEKKYGEAPSSNGAGQDETTGKSTDMLTKAKKLWAKTGITWPVYKMLFKGALAPTIAISAYQSTAWANQYTTLGYLIGIMVILSVPIMPRAKFVQTMLIQVFLVCFCCAICLLALFCSVKARQNSEGSSRPGKGGPGTSGLASGGAQTSRYNSSGSAVAAIWLFVMIYGISALRAKMPQYTIPCIMFAVYVNIAMTYGPQFNTMEQAINFSEGLLEAYLTAFAIATGVSLFVFPLTSRQVVFHDINAFIAGLKASLNANLAYLNSLEETDMFAAQRTNTEGQKPERSPEAQAFVTKIRSLAATQAKFGTDLPFAKREIAIGKLGPDDLQQTFKLLREMTSPIVGLSCMSDIFDRASEERGWDRSKSFAHASLADASNELEEARIKSIHEWHALIKLLKEPFASITEVINEGLQHVAITLQLAKSPKQSKSEDPEASGDTPRPGDSAYAAYFYRRADQFQESKKLMLQEWCHIHEIELPTDFFDHPRTENYEAPAWMNSDPMNADRRRLRRQLLVLLYVEFLLYTISQRTYKLILFADRLRASGKLSKSRLVVPGYKTLRKWVSDALWHQQEGAEDYTGNNFGDNVQLGEAFGEKKDPEHLPPRNAWEHSTNQLRKISHFLGSPASKFGFRVAVATMSIGIINYLADTQVFFTKQRLFWAQIMTSIGMSPSSGQSLRTVCLRIFGTFSFMLFAWIAYYIVDEHIAGVLVFYFIFMHVGVWIIVKKPQFLPIGMVGMVTINLIIGYELQVRKIGLERATANGQEYHPVYILGPIRLATVIVGLSVAYIFSVFPYPITEHSQLRSSLGSCLYLVANYYSVVHETVQVRLAGAEGDMEAKNSPGRKLEKVRQQIYSKCHILLAGLRTRAGFIKFDIPIGGKFPLQQYTEVVRRLQDVLNFMSLISIASSSFSELEHGTEKDEGLVWMRHFSKINSEAKLTSQSVTSLLSLLSASVSNGTPLPPYLRVPEPYMLSERLDQLDSDILSVRHIAEPGYASFAVIQLGTKCLVDDLKLLLAGVKGLVGELDFSYHIVSTTDPSQMSSDETLTYSKTRTEDQARSKQE